MANSSPTTTSAKKILLVEDDDALANVYLTRLAAEGFDARRVADGEDALVMATSYQPHLIMLDLMMPKISGFDVLDILRNTKETARTKIIVLSARGQAVDQKRARELGADDYLVKSQVTLTDVVDRLKTHLN